jgi:hypothetical protein
MHSATSLPHLVVRFSVCRLHSFVSIKRSPDNWKVFLMKLNEWIQTLYYIRYSFALSDARHLTLLSYVTASGLNCYSYSTYRTHSLNINIFTEDILLLPLLIVPSTCTSTSLLCFLTILSHLYVYLIKYTCRLSILDLTILLFLHRYS